MWKRFKEWLLKRELRRDRTVLREILNYERAKLEKEWYERRELLEASYEPMKRELAHYRKMALQEAMLNPAPVIITTLNN